MRKQICEWLTLNPEMDLKPVLFYEKEHLGFENKILIWYNDYIGDRGGNDHEENV